MSRFARWGVTVVTMVSVATVVLLVTGWGSAIAANVGSVFVTNPPSNPVNVHEQGTANVNVANTTVPVHEQGTANVNVANTTVPVHEQGTATVQGAVSPAAPATPILLRGELPANPGSSATFQMFNDSTGQTTLSHKLAIGSITVSTQGGGTGATVYVTLRATDCFGNGLGGIEDLTVHGDSTEQLTYPVPEIVPIVGRAPFCVLADVLNGDALGGGNLFIRVVGFSTS